MKFHLYDKFQPEKLIRRGKNSIIEIRQKKMSPIALIFVILWWMPLR